MKRMHDWLVERLGLRLKRSIGFGLMIATTGGVFWYVLAIFGAAVSPVTGALICALVLLLAASAVAYVTIFRHLKGR